MVEVQDVNTIPESLGRADTNTVTVSTDLWSCVDLHVERSVTSDRSELLVLGSLQSLEVNESVSRIALSEVAPLVAVLDKSNRKEI